MTVGHALKQVLRDRFIATAEGPAAGESSISSPVVGGQFANIIPDVIAFVEVGALDAEQLPKGESVSFVLLEGGDQQFRETNSETPMGTITGNADGGSPGVLFAAHPSSGADRFSACGSRRRAAQRRVHRFCFAIRRHWDGWPAGITTTDERKGSTMSLSEQLHYKSLADQKAKADQQLAAWPRYFKLVKKSHLTDAELAELQSLAATVGKSPADVDNDVAIVEKADELRSEPEPPDLSAAIAAASEEYNRLAAARQGVIRMAHQRVYVARKKLEKLQDDHRTQGPSPESKIRELHLQYPELVDAPDDKGGP